MNFVINITGRRQIGVVRVHIETNAMLPLAHEDHAELHYMEMRNDAETGANYVALVYKTGGVSDR